MGRDGSPVLWVPGEGWGIYYVHIRYLCEKHLKWKWNENNWSLGNEMGHYVLINLVYISVDSWVPWSCGTMAAEGGGFTEWQDYSEHKGSESDSRTEMFCQCSRWKDQLPNFFLDLDIISGSFFLGSKETLDIWLQICFLLKCLWDFLLEGIRIILLELFCKRLWICHFHATMSDYLSSLSHNSKQNQQYG